jgi:hypothetical protein
MSSNKDARIEVRVTPELKEKFEKVLKEDLNGMKITPFFENVMIIAIEASRFYHSLPPIVFEHAQKYQDEFPYEPYFLCLIKALNHRLIRFFQHLLSALDFDDASDKVAAFLESKGVEPESSDNNDSPSTTLDQ